MKFYEDYDFLLKQFESGDERLDETTFFFRTDPTEEEHCIGYIADYEKPYWIGYCDIPDGCEYRTAKEMFEAKVFDKQSIKDRWGEIVITNIGGIRADEWDISWFENR